MRYIALLRGINVGGKHKVAMIDLRTHFEAAGFSDVSTYINSGNVIFSSDESDVMKLRGACTDFLSENYDFPIPVMVITAEDVRRAMEHTPDWWNIDKDSSHNAIFVIPPVTTDDVLAAVGATKPDYEQFACFGNVIFWSAPRITFGRTSFSRISSTTVYGNVTIRNANTALKLASLASETIGK